MSSSNPNTAPSVWSLISSIGLVIFGPQLLLVIIGLFTGGFGLGTPELTLLMVIWCVGIPLVVVRWIIQRTKSAAPSSA